MTAMGLTPDQARSSLRISFSKFNTVTEAMTAARVVRNCVALIENAKEV